MQKKKILCLIDILAAGGAQRQMVGLATFLKERGYDVQVAAYHDNVFYKELLANAGVQYVYLQKAERSITRVCAVSRYIKQSRPDTVIAFLETPSILACLAKMFNRSFNLIVSERNTTQHIGRNEKIRFKLFEQADHVVPNSYSQETFIKEHFPKLSSKTVAIPNFVDLDYFVPQPHERREIPEIMVAASVWPPKNPKGFIRAVAALKHQGVKFHVSWYGITVKHAEYYRECQKLIDENGLGDCIELFEKTQQIKSKYQEADYFCLPSFYEGTPNVICEAMACGLPIICSDVCDNGRYVREGVNGALFNPRSEESMVTAIVKMLGLSDELYQSYSQRSRKIAEDELSRERFVNQYIELIDNMK